MQEKTSYILWLPSWYPNKLDPFDGDFIQRHAQAVSLRTDVHVIFVKADEGGKITRNLDQSFTKKEKLSEHIIYFKKTVSFLGRMNSFRKWVRLFKKAVKDHIKENGKPQLVHVHVAIRAGIIAKWIKRKWGIDYVVTEHWAGYLPEAQTKLSDLPGYIQIACRRIMKNAASISVVSTYLGQCLEKILRDISFTVIPNVVDTSIFKPVPIEKNKTVSFIHISLLNYQKNAGDIIRAMSILKKANPNFHLMIFGPLTAELIRLVEDLDLLSEISFHEEIPQVELAKFIQQSDALILYSRYETFGCVIIEALACGKPVILSDLPVLHENAREGFNAIFAKNEDPADLAEKLNWFMQNMEKFDGTAIAQQAALTYGYDKVGKQFFDWYKGTI
jgi:glycosyltransferase involved in cell wall biosynthesis